jgi:hypothetical protein
MYYVAAFFWGQIVVTWGQKNSSTTHTKVFVKKWAKVVRLKNLVCLIQRTFMKKVHQSRQIFRKFLMNLTYLVNRFQQVAKIAKFLIFLLSSLIYSQIWLIPLVINVATSQNWKKSPCYAVLQTQVDNLSCAIMVGKKKNLCFFAL